MAPCRPDGRLRRLRARAPGTARCLPASAWRGTHRRSWRGCVLVSIPRIRSWSPIPGWPGSDRGSPGSGRRGAGGDAPVCTGAGDFGCGRQVGVECLAEFAGVLLGQVDGVIHAVEPELDRAIGVAAVEIVREHRDDLLGHSFPTPRNARKDARSNTPPRSTIAAALIRLPSALTKRHRPVPRSGKGPGPAAPRPPISDGPDVAGNNARID